MLQGIKKEEELTVAASKITIYSKQESCSLPFSLLHRMQNGLKRRRCRQAFAEQTSRALGARNRTVLPTLKEFLLSLSSFEDRLLWLHIAISVLFSALRLAFHLSCPSVAEVTSTESGGVSPIMEGVGGKVEWMSLWHDRASLARYET